MSTLVYVTLPANDMSQWTSIGSPIAVFHYFHMSHSFIWCFVARWRGRNT